MPLIFIFLVTLLFDCETLLPRLLDMLRECADRGRFVQDVAWQLFELEFAAQARDKINAEQRVAAKLEEVVVYADLLQAKRCFPNHGYRGLQVVSWWDVGRAQRWPGIARLLLPLCPFSLKRCIG